MRPLFNHNFIIKSSFIVISLALVASIFYIPSIQSAPSSPAPSLISAPAPTTLVSNQKPAVIEPKIIWPISRATERVTKKEFGQLIEAGHSPVPGDRFSGYHVGTDFEIFEGEEDEAITIHAICEGPLVLKKLATGYGGVAVQACQFDGQELMVIYGHLKLESISAQPKEILTIGQTVGLLGAGYSAETDGVRKHLHLGIHQGTALDIRGYVKDKIEIDQWLDPLIFINYGIL